MPIYEYQCTRCHHELEVLQGIHEPPPALCPACGGDSLQRKVSAAGFRLTGSGWYETDFKNDKKPPPSKEATTTPEAGTADKAPAAPETTPQKKDTKE